MSRYFKIAPAAYESTRIELDTQLGVTAPETIYMPLPLAPKAADGDALLAVRDAHCDVEAVAAAISRVLTAGDGVEIDQQAYESLRPRQRLV